MSQFGENYELISYVLPGRDRKACKNKFKTEDKKNPARITYCLNNRKPYGMFYCLKVYMNTKLNRLACGTDIATLSRMTGKDFSGPPPEIRAPTPVRSTELPSTVEEESPSEKPRPVRKKSRPRSVRDTDVEIIGNIDDMAQEDG